MFRSTLTRLVLLTAFAFAQTLPAAHAADASADPTEHAADFIAHDFHFSDGTIFPDLRIHYVTLGTPRRDAHGEITNAVLLLHGTTGTGKAFLTPLMRKELFAAGEPLDAQRYFIVMPDGLGRGGSSKPSDGLRTKFPHYGYGDVVDANHRLLVEGLKVRHLRLVLGTSMGGMQTWMWGERYPGMADALMPIASQPIAMGGRNWLWRQMIVGAIRNDPGWQDGSYTTPPTQWARVMPVFTLITGDAARMQELAPDRAAATRMTESIVADAAKTDPNDVLYWFESSWDYNPEPDLGAIRSRLFAVNFADDLINATDLNVMQRLIGKVPQGRYVEMPETAQSYGHQTLAHPEVWKPYLIQLMNGA
ncbi:Homoserine O-acetyltransferase [Paraburkholderia caribensis MBA4]|uniref:Homoserine O-acetyltransferase n=1 Tax=Paraburkholderia caribensis MBA4 TaxID=1323664 RepID=A0A0P0RI32_9BURK|nr:alpha/beta fold hydrolase [Paraburkholderia caribensis]ALL68214.1 Homoserine O-acetyltransferase [Paraburkholderia caribensis MBA4]